MIFVVVTVGSTYAWWKILSWLHIYLMSKKSHPYERRYKLHKYGDGDARLLAVAMTVNNLIEKT